MQCERNYKNVLIQATGRPLEIYPKSGVGSRVSLRDKIETEDVMRLWRRGYCFEKEIFFNIQLQTLGTNMSVRTKAVFFKAQLVFSQHFRSISQLYVSIHVTFETTYVLLTLHFKCENYCKHQILPTKEDD